MKTTINSNTCNDKKITEPKRQHRVRCYTCSVRKVSRDGVCKHFAENDCPHGYHNEDKELYNDLLMEQQEQM